LPLEYRFSLAPQFFHCLAGLLANLCFRGAGLLGGGVGRSPRRVASLFGPRLRVVGRPPRGFLRRSSVAGVTRGWGDLTHQKTSFASPRRFVINPAGVGDA
jgi:hypothetical protein